jgi:hypothetical protein
MVGFALVSFERSAMIAADDGPIINAPDPPT